MAAQFATPEAINFMAKEGRGLICLALTPERCDELGLDLMAAKNESPFETAFTVSIEAREGVTTGISAHDRAHTIQVAIDPESRPRDLVQPGHIFPLKAKAGGVLERTGQTEAAVDLARLAGLNPAGVICEIMNDDGTMARVPDLERYCERHDLKMVTVADLIATGAGTTSSSSAWSRPGCPTDFGDFTRGRLPLAGRRQAPRGDGQGRGRRRGGRARARALRVPHRRRVPLAALRLRPAARGRAAARSRRRAAACCSTSRRRAAASACSTSCAPTSCRRRGSTRSTPTSSSACPPTCATTASARRSSSTSASRSIRLLTNNPKKIVGLEGYGLRVTDQIPIEHHPTAHNRDYLRTKRERMGHLLHHQGLALDEEMIHDEQVQGPQSAGSSGRWLTLGDRRRALLRGPRRAAGRRSARACSRPRRRGGRLRRAGRVRAAAGGEVLRRLRALRRASPAWAP